MSSSLHNIDTYKHSPDPIKTLDIVCSQEILDEGFEPEVAGVRTGVQTVWCDLVTARSMIQDVVDNWSQDPDEQRASFKDSNVGII